MSEVISEPELPLNQFDQIKPFPKTMNFKKVTMSKVTELNELLIGFTLTVEKYFF